MDHGIDVCQYGGLSIQEVPVPVRELPLTSTTGACCGIGVAGGMSRADAERSASLLKAVADPVRLRLVSAIRATEAGEACVCDLTDLVGLAQPTVSHHLKVLTDAGLLERERRGSWAWYRLVPERLAEVRGILA
ncbi:ArsR/SmtB family transcription factor [Phycicoccus jejuensis]|uniref:ArsR/SmtB family transcription factor n=2 Tax=Phycicoccus TaxID=367298 RepID=UPI00384C0FBF